MHSIAGFLRKPSWVKRSAVGLCLASALLLLSACSSESGDPAASRSPRPTSPPVNVDTVTYTSTRNSRSEIHQISVFGTSFLNLSGSKPSSNSHPNWSPDGTQLAFSSAREGSGDIYLMKDDGSGQRRVTFEPSPEAFPAWSPDGRQIAFVSTRDSNSEIYVMNVDGSDQRRLTTAPGSDSLPAWSPDGSQIAFESSRGGNIDIYAMNADGSNQRPLISGDGVDFAPAWSPDGERIAFASDRDGHADIMLLMRTAPALRS